MAIVKMRTIHRKKVTQEKHPTFEVRDLREHGFFTVDDEYLDGRWLRLLKGCPSAVYFALCRHADRKQIAFPSVQYLMDETGYRKRHVIDSIKRLESHRLIAVNREQRDHNIYSLLNRRQWRKIAVSRQTGRIDKGDLMMKSGMAIPIINDGPQMVE